MSDVPASTRAIRFDALYTTNPDPWNFRDSKYERAKYKATLKALPHKRYHLAVEAGCSIGTLTALLAKRCDRIIGIDVSNVALQEARTANAAIRNAVFIQGELPDAWPTSDADLIVLSEVLYFLTLDEIDTLAALIAPHWVKDGACVLVNWLGPTDGDLLTSPQAADHFIAALSRHASPKLITSTGTEKYRLDVLLNQ